VQAMAAPERSADGNGTAMKISYFHRYETPRATKAKVLAAIDANVHYLGAATDSFESKLAAACGRSHAVTTNAGTSALLMALQALGIGPDDEVIVPATTYVAVIGAIAHVGATPIVVECLEHDGNIDPEAVSAAVTDHTRLVVVGHHHGHPADMPTIVAIAERSGLRILENCAHALGARIGDQPVGSLGDLATLSMSHKHLSVAGTGGAVGTDDAELAEQLRAIRHQGFPPTPPWDDPRPFVSRVFGHKMFLNELQAIIGDHQMDVMPEWIADRRTRAHAYAERLSTSCPEVYVKTDAAPDTYPTYLHVGVLADERDALWRWLEAAGIEARAHYAVPVHLHPACIDRFGFRAGAYPVAERYCRRTLSLPGAPHLDSDAIESVVDTIIAFYARQQRRPDA
jgi:dTDP-3-amino-2,3,6-trideoxy-4-keto-D-glucose/dTDP-3-amino-3,4,6-trideoxy-alpha-D-glucose/dTDP-2,6-dideoxy-D-kanosamine transaminase